ncbi:Monocarboxylate transporter 10, partial [Eufriesea mexicana]
MAASRVDLEIGDDRTASKSQTHCESRSSSDSSVTESEIAKKRKIVVEKDGMGRQVILEDRREISHVRGSNSSVHDRPERNKSLPSGDKSGKSKKSTQEPADKSKSFHAEIKDRKSSRRDDAYEFPADQKLVGVGLGNDNPIQIKKQRGTRARRNPESEQTSISARVIYKLVGSSRQRGSKDANVGKKALRELSPRHRARNHANLIADTTEGTRVEGLGDAGTEVPRKLADCQRDRSTVKRREDAEKKIAGSSTSQESPRVSEPRSSNDVTPVRKVRRHVGQAKCENCDKSHVSNEKSHLHKYSGFLDCEGLPLDENYAREANGREPKHEAPVASLPLLSVHDSGVACSGNEPAVGHAHNSKQLVADLKQLHTLKQHYYPEGGWGWVVMFVGVLVQMLSHGVHGSNGIFLQQVARKFDRRVYLESGWLGAMSTGVALLVSPVTIAFCRRKSTRLTAVLGGLVTALGCLFTSFASQFHQLFFSYGAVVGIGVGMTRDCSTLMVAQYFKRRRELVEIFIVSGSGLGIAVMSAFIKGMISKIGWRLGLQAVTGVVFLTFILGTFYRSASLYHPQRRAILHLKNQKRKIKDKNKTDDGPPFFDFSTLKSKTVRILLVSTGISAFGINTPIFYLAHQAEKEGLGDTVILLQAYLGLAWTLGCVAFGLLVVHRSVECRIARQYLTQAAVFVCGLCILALTAVQGNYHGYVLFAWIYGIFCGGYHYSLKMYTYERVRARNFARTWGLVQCSQAIPIAIGVPISGYMNIGYGGKAGYYFSSTCVLVGSFTLFFIDLHRRNLSRHKHTRSNGTKHICVSESCPQRRKLSFSQEPDNDGTHVAAAGAAAAALVLGTEIAPNPGI